MEIDILDYINRDEIAATIRAELTNLTTRAKWDLVKWGAKELVQEMMQEDIELFRNEIREAIRESISEMSSARVQYSDEFEKEMALGFESSRELIQNKIKAHIQTEIDWPEVIANGVSEWVRMLVAEGEFKRE